MNVSIFTDASYDSSMGTSAAGAGAWIKSNYIRGNSCRYSKGFLCKDANHAELRAIVLGLAQAIKLHESSTDNLYIITSDSDTAIDWILGIKNCPTGAVDMVKYIKDLTSKYHVQFNRIKSHRGACTPRNAVNETVDRMAKSEMRKIRDESLRKKVA
ncbi:ribonuclease H-like domain protein [Vibrio phage 1.031.O._10N.261.46.F8]|nr:ribonuclease H-like domain protein [Vibrio phage 1.031.O._10N.261.46.F8]